MIQGVQQLADSPSPVTADPGVRGADFRCPLGPRPIGPVGALGLILVCRPRYTSSRSTGEATA